MTRSSFERADLGRVVEGFAWFAGVAARLPQYITAEREAGDNLCVQWVPPQVNL